MLRVPRRIIYYAPLLFFGTLLLVRAMWPTKFVFDEVYYVPAAKALATLTDNLNWEHPPLVKLILGWTWALFSQGLGLFPEIFALRAVTILFGLAALWGVRAWMKTLGYSEKAAQAATWLTGFNFLWFVQSKTVMLDIYFVAFGIWGLLYVYKNRPLGFVLLGLSMASKWSAAPFFVIALFFARKKPLRAIQGLALSFVVYVISFLPLAFLKNNAVAPTDLIAYHRKMLEGFASLKTAVHPYESHWWEWPTLMRPIWYLFEPSGSAEIGVWAGGNPILYAVALPFFALVAWVAVKSRDKPAQALALLYWVPLLFWAVSPRAAQMYYYYLPSSIWAGPVVVWAHERYYRRFRETRGWLLFGFVLLCAAIFLYFLPIMDGRALPQGQYHRYMWFRAWI